MSWNLRGKSLDDVARIWDLLSLDGTHVIGLQELGGLPESCPSHDVALHTEVTLAGRSYTFFYADSSHAFRGSALGIPTSWLGKVEKTTTHRDWGGSWGGGGFRHVRKSVEPEVSLLWGGTS